MIRETATLLKNLGARLDALAFDLARDGGAIVREAQALVQMTEDRVGTIVRATPRMTKLAQIAAGIFARARWMGLANAAKTGDARLTVDDHRELARRVATHAADLRGGIAKLGQLASCRPDMIGPVWAAELATLQDEVPAIATDLIRARIESELGAPIESIFAEFSDTPIAAASLAQVHVAKLLDGTDVVVKVQVPGIEDVIAADIAALRAIATNVDLPGMDLVTLSDELARALVIELDYRAEAASLLAYKGNAIVPKPIAHASTARVLTMTKITGERLTAFLDRATPEQRSTVIGKLVAEVAAQILERGYVHADPHPGNFLVTPEDNLAILDFGCVLELSPADRAAYARLVIAIAGGNHTSAAGELTHLGFICDDPAQLVELTTSLIGALKPGTNVSDLDWNAAFGEQLARAKTLGGFVIPRSFVLLGRVLASIAGLLATYKPSLQLHPLIARHLAAAIV
ncbi:MAG: AarF/ABC1/UbiB kinase family protein [Kofleriaceae bacterium]